MAGKARAGGDRAMHGCFPLGWIDVAELAVVGDGFAAQYFGSGSAVRVVARQGIRRRFTGLWTTGSLPVSTW